MLDIDTGELEVRSLNKNVAAMAFDTEHRLIVSREDGDTDSPTRITASRKPYLFGN